MACKICNQSKEHEAFGMCKKCYMKEYRKTYYQENKEDILKKNREHYLKNKETYLKKSKVWHKNNLEKARLKDRKNYWNNREKVIKRKLDWLKTPKGKLYTKLDNQKKYALRRQVQHLFSNKDWKLILEKTKGICPKCNNNVGIISMTLDHIIPISSKEKLIYTIKDVQPLCRSCNASKGNKLQKLGMKKELGI